MIRAARWLDSQIAMFQEAATVWWCPRNGQTSRSCTGAARLTVRRQQVALSGDSLKSDTYIHWHMVNNRYSSFRRFPEVRHPHTLTYGQQQVVLTVDSLKSDTHIHWHMDNNRRFFQEIHWSQTPTYTDIWTTGGSFRRFPEVRHPHTLTYGQQQVVLTVDSLKSDTHIHWHMDNNRRFFQEIHWSQTPTYTDIWTTGGSFRRFTEVRHPHTLTYGQQQAILSGDSLKSDTHIHWHVWSTIGGSFCRFPEVRHPHTLTYGQQQAVLSGYSLKSDTNIHWHMDNNSRFFQEIHWSLIPTYTDIIMINNRRFFQEIPWSQTPTYTDIIMINNRWFFQEIPWSLTPTYTDIWTTTGGSFRRFPEVWHPYTLTYGQQQVVLSVHSLKSDTHIHWHMDNNRRFFQEIPWSQTPTYTDIWTTTGGSFRRFPEVRHPHTLT